VASGIFAYMSLKIFPGRIESGYHNGDLRDRLERRRSTPIRRHSPPFRGRPGAHYDRMLSPPDRGGRSRTRTPPIRPRLSRSPSPQRSPPIAKRRESKRPRIAALEPHFSDVSGDVRGTEDVYGEGDFKQLGPAAERMSSPIPPRNPRDTHDTRDTLEDQVQKNIHLFLVVQFYCFPLWVPLLPQPTLASRGANFSL
jgi:hypothetical protein